LRGAPAALAGDDFVFVVADRPHHDRLHQALRAYRIGKLFECFLIHVAARLVFAALQKLHRQFAQIGIGRHGGDRIVLGGFFRCLMTAEQRIETATQSPFFHAIPRCCNPGAGSQSRIFKLFC
jgi:hypothetical protein